MFIKHNIKKQNNRTYYQYVLTESVRTPKGPRHKSIVSLGDLKPRPAKDWLKLARRVEETLMGQLNIFEKSDHEVLAIVEKIKRRRLSETRETREKGLPKTVTVNPNEIETEEHKEFGPAFLVTYFWDLLNFGEILQDAGLSGPAIQLTFIAVANRLIYPESDYKIPQWAKQTEICALAGFPEENLNDDRMYRLLDELYPRREEIERGLYQRERDLFNLEGTLMFIDFTSFYFEGSCQRNWKAKRGYSRDKRPDCKQFVWGAAIGREGFPIASEVFEGNAQDGPTFPEMLKKIHRRVDVEGRTLIFDRGIATKKNMEFLENSEKRYDWIIAARSWESEDWVEEIESEGWEKIPLTGKVAGCKAPAVNIKLFQGKAESIVLIKSEGRREKDRAIRERQEKKMEEQLTSLSNRVKMGRVKKKEKIWQNVGRLRERYPRVGRYYEVELKGEGKRQELSWEKNEEKLLLDRKMDGIYLLRTNRMDIEEEEIFRAYLLLNRIENIFKDLKGPIKTQPNRHHRTDRAETHIFQCVLALHILTAIEHRLKEKEDTRSWETIRDILKTHQTCSIMIPTTDGETYRIRKPSKMEEEHYKIYRKLGVITGKQAIY